MGLLSFFRNLLGSKSKSSGHAQPRPQANISSQYFAVISASTALSASAVKAVEAFTQTDSCNYLCRSKATRADTAIFSCFVLRALCIMSTNDRGAAATFSDSFISSFIRMSQETFSFDIAFPGQFNSRVDFYDRVFTKKQGVDNKLSAIVEEFEYIIKTDIIEGAFATFSETSPLPILGILDDMGCRMEVGNYFQFLLAYVDSELAAAFKTLE